MGHLLAKRHWMEATLARGYDTACRPEAKTAHKEVLRTAEQPDMVPQFWNPSTPQAEAGAVPQIQAQPGLQSKTLSQKKSKKASGVVFTNVWLLRTWQGPCLLLPSA